MTPDEFTARACAHLVNGIDVRDGFVAGVTACKNVSGLSEIQNLWTASAKSAMLEALPDVFWRRYHEGVEAVLDVLCFHHGRHLLPGLPTPRGTRVAVAVLTESGAHLDKLLLVASDSGSAVTTVSGSKIHVAFSSDFRAVNGSWRKAARMRKKASVVA